MNLMAQPIQPEKAYFKDDGSIPNNVLPLLLYRQAFAPDTPGLPSAIEERFAKNNWTGSWRAGVFPFHHYQSTTHEVLAQNGREARRRSLRSGVDRAKIQAAIE